MERLIAAQDRLAECVTDLTSLHELTEQLTRAATLEEALHELLRGGATLVGARRGLLALGPDDGTGPERTIGLGLGRADLGHVETVPRGSSSFARLLDGVPAPATAGAPPSRPRGPRENTPADPGSHGVRPAPEGPQHAAAPPPYPEILHPDIAADHTLDPHHREVAARLGCAASYAVPLTTEAGNRLAAAVWLYDEPAAPTPRQRRLLGRYVRHAASCLARHRELDRARREATSLREELLPATLPRVPGVRLAVRHRAGPAGGGDWYDALALPDGALCLSVGGVTGHGPEAAAVMGRLRTALRAYAVMEGEDPVAVLSDLELLLRLTEPARSATALFAYAEPAARRVTLAGAGQCPPLVTGAHRTEFVETSLSAPLGMLACWEAPGAELVLRPGETLLLYSDGLLHRTGADLDRAFSRLHAAAADAPAAARADPGQLTDHVLRTLLPDGGAEDGDHPEDVVLLAARF